MKLNYKRTVYVGLAFFIISIFWQTYDTIIPKILVDKFGMNQSLSGFIMALDNILALFLLPLFGHISDKTNTKIGKRKPFVIIGTLLAVVFFISTSFADNAQLTKLQSIEDNKVIVQSGVLESDGLKVDGKQILVALSEQGLSIENFESLTESANAELFDKFVKPARSAYAWQLTKDSPATLIAFVILLLFVLLSMSLFRSPAVALMPDVTAKPLRSKANAVINLMGSAGGIAALLLGILFKTGKLTYMSYTGFFSSVSAIMLIALLVFILRVKEPQWTEDMQQQSQRQDEQPAPQQPEKAVQQKVSAYAVSADSIDDNTLTADSANSSGTSPTVDIMPTEEKLSRPQMRSLLLILASVFLWFTGYNAVVSKFSVYAGNVLSLEYNTPLMIAQIAAIISFIPIGNIASRVGRKKTVLAGIVMLTASFTLAAFITRNSGPVMYLLFAFAGIAWATINVNSFPMVVELSRGGNIGKYTGYYYTASMAAQIMTPVLSGILMDVWDMRVLFPYAALFAALSFVTMLFTKHGDNIPSKAKGLEAFDN